jgi:hypothetical protein
VAGLIVVQAGCGTALLALAAIALTAFVVMLTAMPETRIVDGLAAMAS